MISDEQKRWVMDQLERIVIQLREDAGAKATLRQLVKPLLQPHDLGDTSKGGIVITWFTESGQKTELKSAAGLIGKIRAGRFTDPANVARDLEVIVDQLRDHENPRNWIYFDIKDVSVNRSTVSRLARTSEYVVRVVRGKYKVRRGHESLVGLA